MNYLKIRELRKLLIEAGKNPKIMCGSCGAMLTHYHCPACAPKPCPDCYGKK